MYKVIYCGNCGKKGHIYKNCYKPVISLGIICIMCDGYNLNEIININKSRGYNYSKYALNDLKINDKYDKKIRSLINFLLICRKHTINYIEFIRGNYNLTKFSDIENIKNLFERMTHNEVDNIKNKGFDDLWNNIWIYDKLTNSHQKEYLKAKDKFMKLVDGIQLNDYAEIIDLKYILDNCQTQYIEPEWGFPKGRRNIREEDLECANREFKEETNMQNNNYTLLDTKPISEIYMGSNNINYKHTYYLAQYLDNNKDTFEMLNNKNVFQKIEISKLKWMSIDEAMSKIRNYSIERKIILQKVYDLIYYNLYVYMINKKN